MKKWKWKWCFSKKGGGARGASREEGRRKRGKDWKEEKRRGVERRKEERRRKRREWLELRRLPPDHGFCVSKYSLLRKTHTVPYKGACSTQRHGVSARAGDPSCLELH